MNKLMVFIERQVTTNCHFSLQLITECNRPILLTLDTLSMTTLKTF